MNITDATIFDCDGAALLLERCRDCRLSGLMIRDHRIDKDEALAARLIDCEDVRLVDDGVIRGRVVEQLSQ